MTADDGKLPSWRSITSPVDLSNISGLGSYTTSFDLGKSWNKTNSGAFLNLGHNFQTYQLTVNGHLVSGADQVDTSGIDVGPYLKAGVNQLQVRVSTTMRNAILTQAPNAPHGSSTERQDYGLTGPVTITPYRTETVNVARTKTAG